MVAELIELDASEAGQVLTGLSLAPAEAMLLSPEHPFLRHGTWRAFALDRGGGAGTRMVASLDTRQQSGGRPVGCIGFVRTVAAAERDGAAADLDEVLGAAAAWLRREGAGEIRCPVQLSTWYGHRAVMGGFSEAGGAPPFLLEPRNGPMLVDGLTALGFTPAHRAVSTIAASDAVLAHGAEVLGRPGLRDLRDRPFRPRDLDAELQLLHTLSLEIFRDNWGFSGISLDEFLAVYRPVARIADPELVRILETAGGEPIGFSFALPDSPVLPPAGAEPPAVVLKTLGIVPAARRRNPGIGVALTAMIHRAAVERGYRRAIHALMTDGDAAHRLSTRWGPTMRTYATFAGGAP
jgi:hypothetical protein